MTTPRTLVRLRSALALTASALVTLGVVAAGTSHITPRSVSDEARLASGAPTSTGASSSVARRSSTTVGVATFNAFRNLNKHKMWADRRAAALDPRIDIIGWQESERYPGQLRILSKRYGFATKRFAGAEVIAVSWRRSQFQYVSARIHKMHDGCAPHCGLVPFGPRYVERVTLRHRATGRTVTVLNTHLNSFTENLDWPGHPRRNLNAERAQEHIAKMARMWGAAPGTYVIGTGDYNWDYVADSKVNASGFLADRFAGRAINSYQALGTGSLTPTHPESKRFIDYVWLARKDADEASFVAHASLTGYNTDHVPLLATLDLH